MNTKPLRLKYNNEWPQRFHFPVEEEFLALMQSREVEQALLVAPLEFSDEYQFQLYLGYLLDVLDILPMRPDLAFDHLWKALGRRYNAGSEPSCQQLGILNKDEGKVGKIGG